MVKKTQEQFVAEQKQYFKHSVDPEKVFCPIVIIAGEVSLLEDIDPLTSKMLGYIPVYLEREDARSDFPEYAIKEIWLADVQ